MNFTSPNAAGGRAWLLAGAVLLASCTGGASQTLSGPGAVGDFGATSGGFGVEQTQDTTRIRGDVGPGEADYTITRSGAVDRFKGDFGTTSGDFTATRSPHTVEVTGDVGPGTARYKLETDGNTVRVHGDFGTTSGDYSVVHEGDLTTVAGDFGPASGRYTIREENGVWHVFGDVGHFSADFTVTRLDNGDHRVQGDVGPGEANYVARGGQHPPEVAALLNPAQAQSAAWWPRSE